MKLKVPHCEQKSDSACCGPCCLVMLGDYYKIKKPNGKSYTKNSLIQLVKQNRQHGTTLENMRETLDLMGLKYHKLKTRYNLTYKIGSMLRKGNPVLALIPDHEEYFTDHYVVIKGYDDDKNLFTISDPYYGANRILAEDVLEVLLKFSGKQAWAIFKPRGRPKHVI